MANIETCSPQTSYAVQVTFKEEQQQKSWTLQIHLFWCSHSPRRQLFPTPVGFTTVCSQNQDTIPQREKGLVLFWRATWTGGNGNAITTVEANSHRKIAPANISVSRIRGINRSNLSKGSDTYISFSFHQAQLSMFATILTCRVFWDWKNWLPMTMPCLWQMESILLSALVQVCPLIEIEQLMSLYIDVNVIQIQYNPLPLCIFEKSPQEVVEPQYSPPTAFLMIVSSRCAVPNKHAWNGDVSSPWRRWYSSALALKCWTWSWHLWLPKIKGKPREKKRNLDKKSAKIMES